MNSRFIISSSEFKNGFFPKIPKETKGKAVLLSSEKTGNLIRVTSKVTPREVSIGKYDEKIILDMTEKTMELNFTIPSRELAYSFDVKLNVAVSIIDPLEFYERNIDNIEGNIQNELKSVIKNSVKKYSVLKYDGIDDFVIDELKNNNFNIQFISIRFINADCKPNESAAGYIKRIRDDETEKIIEMNRHKNQTEIEGSKIKNAKELVNTEIKEAIMLQVVEGKISMEDALIKYENYKQEDGDRKIANLINIKNLRDIIEGYDDKSEKLIDVLINEIIGTAPMPNNSSQKTFPTIDESNDAYNNANDNIDNDNIDKENTNV